MSSLDIAPCPEGAPISGRDRCRTRRRPRVSFRRAGICTFWRLGFKQSSFHRIARVSRHTVPDTWTRSPVSWHALVPLTFQRRVSHQTQGHSSNPSRLNRGYDEAPRGARWVGRMARCPLLRVLFLTAPRRTGRASFPASGSLVTYAVAGIAAGGRSAWVWS